MISDSVITQSRILIIDDMPVNVMVLEATLRRDGFTNITTVTDPRMVENEVSSSEFDLIFLDIRMPHINGFELCERLASNVADDDYLPVIVVTAQTDKQTRHRSLQLGAKDFITKPFDNQEILSRTRNSLEIRALYKERRNHAITLERKVAERTRELEDAQLEIVRRLGIASSFRDNETGAHVQRMSEGCRLIALEAGLGETFAQMILRASPMHDVGKIGIPDGVLLKPGPLDPDEWATMQTHAQIGADMLANHPSPVMQMAERIAKTHHERWDGKGYPNRLSGMEIPVEGRICAVSDVFDALTSRRPYKEPWPVEKAISFIEEGAGSQFDPEIVKCFLRVAPQIAKLRLSTPDEEPELPDDRGAAERKSADAA
ncbi:MAG: response regulator [Rhodospirillales bacterium]